MSTFLLIDIGAGTMDVLHYDTETSLHLKAVSKSPVLYMAEKARDLPGDLIITGREMGGGAISRALQERAQKAEVVMSMSAAATIHHNVERVRAMGFKVVEDQEAVEIKNREGYTNLDIGDVDIERLRHIVHGLGLPFYFDVVGLCAQDHGVPPEGVSHLDCRHQMFKSVLDEAPFPHRLLYEDLEIPESLSRLSSIAVSARRLPADEVYVMDSGMAAILGASMDPRARQEERVLTIDIATSHTLGAALEGDKIAGFFEYHTSDLTPGRVESLLRELADGDLEHEQIVREGGHGAYVRKALGFQSIGAIVATGPKRALIEGSTLPVTRGAPLGDNMMTGTVGLLEAMRKRKGLEPIDYS
jgi:uncharacterized protein (DUF1786 family)